MNKLDFTHNGGVPLYLDDFRFLQQANLQALQGVLSFLPEDKVIVLSGLSYPSGVNNFIEEGFVLFEREIYFVPGAGGFSSINHLTWDFTPGIDSSGDRTTQSGNNISPYRVGTAKLIGTSTPLSGKKFMEMGEIHQDTKGFYDALAERLDLVPPGAVMLWFGTLANIPAGWEQATGQMGFFGGPFPTQAPDLRRSIVWGHDSAAAPAPFNTIKVQTPRYIPPAGSTAIVQGNYTTGVWIIKNGSNIPTIFTY